MSEPVLYRLAGRRADYAVLREAACLLERMVLGRDFGVNIATFPQLACLFIIGMKHPDKFARNALGWIGKRLSMLVYVLHMFIWRYVIDCVYVVLHVSKNPLALYMKPVAVLGVSILLSYAVVFCTSKICLKMKNTREMEMKS